MRRYVPSDLSEINAWHRAWGVPELPSGSLPEFGLIEPGVAAGFLYRTDSGMALIEGLISNPRSGRDDRNAALDAIGDELVAEAERQGFRWLLAISRNQNVQARAVRHGFRDSGKYAIMAKEIN